MTQEQAFKKYLHMYVGGEARVGTNRRISRIEFAGISSYKQEFEMEYWGYKNAHHTLYLRSYSTMTDAEALEFARLRYEDAIEAKYSYDDDRCIVLKRKDGVTRWFCDLYQFTPEQFAWLLSKGFDVFGLITAGHAKELKS